MCVVLRSILLQVGGGENHSNNLLYDSNQTIMANSSFVYAQKCFDGMAFLSLAVSLEIATGGGKDWDGGSSIALPESRNYASFLSG